MTETKMSLDTAEKILNNLLTDPRLTGSSSASARVGQELDKLERQAEELQTVEETRNEIETKKESEQGLDRTSDAPAPALRDATTALTRLDETARRAAHLAHTAEKLTFIVGKYESLKGEGPAYMNVAVRSLREEIRPAFMRAAPRRPNASG